MTNEIKSESTQPNIPHKEKKEKRSEKIQEGKAIYRTRLIPIWLRLVIILVLLIVAIIIGLIVGYSVIGDGKALDALKWGTYEQIFDIMRGKE